MSTFTYRAKKMSGEEISGARDVASRAELASLLRAEGYILISYKEKVKVSPFSFMVGGIRGVSVVDKMVFARNLAEMIGAGVSLTRGIEVLGRQTANKKFKKVLSRMGDDIQKGKPFSDAMEAYPSVFSSLFRSMVRAGEVSGKLQESLTLIANQLERDYDLRRKVRGAFMYPLIIVAVMILIGIVMMIYVIPTLISTFEELAIDLPASTKLVIGISNFLVGHGILAATGAIVFFALLGVFFRSSTGRRALDIFFLNMPLLSGLTQKINSARMARTLGSLINSGVNIIEALQITGHVIQNSYFKHVITEAQEEIQKGNPISAAFIRNERLYPVLVGEMMQVGEETGKLSGMLFRVAEFYEGEVAAETKDLSVVVEPILMVVIGAVVGFFAFAMITPLYSSLGSL
ncbi:MAG: type II secretion system F family protein [bacterium]|nr:type II secretion system F family protein [bacterium]